MRKTHPIVHINIATLYANINKKVSVKSNMDKWVLLPKKRVYGKS